MNGINYKAILRRVKKMTGIEDSSNDEMLIYLIDLAIFQIQSYTHSLDINGLDGIIAQLVGHLYTSGEGSGESGGGTATVGEVKKESYSGVSFEYTTSADFKDSSSSGESGTYFNTIIAPMLKGRRKIQTVRGL